MESLAKKIRTTQVNPGSVAIFWLGQAGFVFKTPSNKIIFTDPYLTDALQRLHPENEQRFKRLMPKVIEAGEVEADYVISTHAHEDHLDLEALPVLRKNPRIHFIGSPDCRMGYEKAGIPPGRLTIMHPGKTMSLDGFNLTGVAADHGELAPDALGYLFNFGGIKVWQVGDTAFRPEIWLEIFEAGVDVILPPINGMYGNLNSLEAAQLAQAAHAKIAIPCHFWMFAGHFGNPAEYLDACKEYAPDVHPLLMTQGELFVYKR